MSEAILRWQARIGSLKALGVLAVIGVGILLLLAAPDANRAFSSPSGPVHITISELLAGGYATHPFVSFSGYAYYEVGYEETSDGRTVANYYLVIDDQSGDSVLVKASTVRLDDRTSGPADIQGLVERASSGLEEAAHADLALYAKQGIMLNPTFYIAEGSRPMGAMTAMGLLLGSAILAVLGLVPLVFPTTVFAPKPVDTLTPRAPGAARSEGVRATGVFQQLKRMEPTLELGRRRQRFTNAVANLHNLPDGRLMIYIHHVVRTKLYGVVTISKQESHWGVFIGRMDLWQVDPGVIYGWRDRWAVRFRRQELGKKPEALYLSFDDVAAQMEFVTQLRKAGFAIGFGTSF